MRKAKQKVIGQVGPLVVTREIEKDGTSYVGYHPLPARVQRQRGRK